MKNTLLVLSLMIGMSAANGQKVEPKNVPASVKASFEKKFPGNTNVGWEKENGQYEASYKINKESHSATFSPDGTFLESEVNIQVSELPSAVLGYMKQHYPGISIGEAARITKANGETNYEAEIKGKDVVFDANGKFLKEEKD